MVLADTVKSLWSYNPVPRGCVFYAPLWALRGGVFRSVDYFRHLCTVTGALWTPQGWSFDATDDIVSIPQSDAFAVGSGNFGFFFWYYSTDGNNNKHILSLANRALALRTSSTPAASYIWYFDNVGSVGTTTNSFNSNGWVCSGFVRSGNDILIYKNGNLFQTITNGASGLSVSTNGIFYLGNLSGATAGAGGTIGDFLWVTGRAPSAGEASIFYNATRWRYQ